MVLAQVGGNLALSKGLKSIGAINVAVLIEFGWQIAHSPWIWLAVVLLISSLVFYLIALSRLDLSYILPLIASNYVLTTFAAWLILGERVSTSRWIGTILITFGVMMVGLIDGKNGKSKITKSKIKI